MRLCCGPYGSPYGSELFYDGDLRLNNRTTMWSTSGCPDITPRYIRDCLNIPMGKTRKQRTPYNCSCIRYGTDECGYIVADVSASLVNQCSGVDDSEL